MMRLLVRPWTLARETKARAFLNGLYWHFPLCCVVAFLFRDGASSGHRPIHMMHPDRSLKVWVPCWWHDKHAPSGAVRDWREIPSDWYDMRGVPFGRWPGEAA